jgi:hypothetical protein
MDDLKPEFDVKKYTETYMITDLQTYFEKFRKNEATAGGSVLANSIVLNEIKCNKV